MSETRTQGAYCARVRRRKFFLILQHWDILVIRSDLQSVLESRCFTLFPFKAPMRNHASVLRRTEQHTKVPLQISKDMFSCGDLSRHLRHKCAPLLFSPQAHTIGGCTRVLGCTQGYPFLGTWPALSSLRHLPKCLINLQSQFLALGGFEQTNIYSWRASDRRSSNPPPL